MKKGNNLFKEYIKFKRNNQMQAIKHLFGKQIVCSSMLFLHVLSFAGSCQARSMVPQPNKADIEGQRVDVLTQAQKQTVTPQNQAQTQQAQETVRMLAQQAQETVRMLAKDASTQAQQAQETARMLAQDASTQAQQAQETARMLAKDALTQAMCVLTTNNNRGAEYFLGAETLGPVTRGATVLSKGASSHTEPDRHLVGKRGESSKPLTSVKPMPQTDLLKDPASNDDMSLGLNLTQSNSNMLAVEHTSASNGLQSNQRKQRKTRLRLPLTEKAKQIKENLQNWNKAMYGASLIKFEGRI